MFEIIPIGKEGKGRSINHVRTVLIIFDLHTPCKDKYDFPDSSPSSYIKFRGDKRFFPSHYTYNPPMHIPLVTADKISVPAPLKKKKKKKEGAVVRRWKKGERQW